jgi:alginate O-acetyltransferase complex protein AlgI
MPDNFRFPYAAIGFSDFWRRWHITLSSWLRDYLYIPLGGNRHGPARTYLALMGTMLLGGLWHGASWTFVVWGGLHGTYLVVERWLRKRFGGWTPGPVSLLALGLLTYALVNVTWVFFRAKEFGTAWNVLRGMAGANADAKPILTTPYLVAVAIFVPAIVVAHWVMRNRTLESAVARVHPAVIAASLGSMAFLILISQGTGNAFIYFQF